MGTGTQVIAFLNAEKIPDDLQMQHRYTAISKTPELLKLRREYRKRLRATQHQGSLRMKPEKHQRKSGDAYMKAANCAKMHSYQNLPELISTGFTESTYQERHPASPGAAG